MKSTHRTRISLVEFLNIIVIAAVLAALLFPVFSQARLKAGGGICLTNMKQILVSARMYSNDYDGELPVQPGTGATGQEKVVPLKPIGVYR
jgi:uncharacterized membrane protein